MTQRDYIKVAGMLLDHGHTLDHTAWLDDRQAQEIRHFYAIGLAEIFAEDNPRFKRDRFYRAAGVPELADN